MLGVGEGEVLGRGKCLQDAQFSVTHLAINDSIALSARMNINISI